MKRVGPDLSFDQGQPGPPWTCLRGRAWVDRSPCAHCCHGLQGYTGRQHRKLPARLRAQEATARATACRWCPVTLRQPLASILVGSLAVPSLPALQSAPAAALALSAFSALSRSPDGRIRPADVARRRPASYSQNRRQGKSQVRGRGAEEEGEVKMAEKKPNLETPGQKAAAFIEHMEGKGCVLVMAKNRYHQFPALPCCRTESREPSGAHAHDRCLNDFLRSKGLVQTSLTDDVKEWLHSIGRRDHS